MVVRLYYRANGHVTSNIHSSSTVTVDILDVCGNIIFKNKLICHLVTHHKYLWYHKKKQEPCHQKGNKQQKGKTYKVIHIITIIELKINRLEAWSIVQKFIVSIQCCMAGQAIHCYYWPCPQFNTWKTFFWYNCIRTLLYGWREDMHAVMLKHCLFLRRQRHWFSPRAKSRKLVTTCSLLQGWLILQSEFWQVDE